MGGNGYSGAESLESYRSETIVRASQRKAIGNILGMLHERTSINKTTKELRAMLIKLIYKILKKLIDNCDKFYLEETDPDVIEAKELLGRVEKAMKAKGDDANAHQ